MAKKIVKCSLCAHRLGDGKQPACVEVCPTGALQFGEYKALKARAAKLAKEKKLALYGYEENGGTHLFILAKTSLTAAGYPKVAKAPVKRSALDTGDGLAVPAAAAAMAVMGFKKFADRKDRIAREEQIEER